MGHSKCVKQQQSENQQHTSLHYSISKYYSERLSVNTAVTCFPSGHSSIIPDVRAAIPNPTFPQLVLSCYSNTNHRLDVGFQHSRNNDYGLNHSLPRKPKPSWHSPTNNPSPHPSHHSTSSQNHILHPLPKQLCLY